MYGLKPVPFKTNTRLVGHPTIQQQIPFGNDRKKNKSKSRSFALLRRTSSFWMTELLRAVIFRLLRYPTLDANCASRMGHPAIQQQIPFGNDRKKNKNKSRSFALLRMTTLQLQAFAD
jgi:hypothetical protein